MGPAFAAGQATGPGQVASNSLLPLGLSVSIKIMARSRFFAVGALVITGSAIAGGVFGRNVVASEERVTDTKTFTAALACHRGAVRRRGQVGPVGVRRDLRDAADAGSAFELHGPAAVRAAARAAGGALLRPRHHHPGDRRRHHRDGAVRRLARLQGRHPPRRHHRQDRGRGRQGLDQRPGRAQAARRQGHHRRGLAEARRATTS